MRRTTRGGVARWLPVVASLCVVCTSARGDDASVAKRLDALGGAATCVTQAGGAVTEIEVSDGSELTLDDVAAFGMLPSLTKLRINNCRELDDAAVERLAGLGGLKTLAITNSGITDAAVTTIVASFPDLVDLDLSSNTNLSGAALRSIATLAKLERLNLMQCRFNDIHTRRLAKLAGLRALDLRGNMEAGDLTLAVAGKLPRLASLKHRSSTVTDEGLAALASSTSLESLLLQDFTITSASGPHLAKLGTLSSLEIFRCQGFGTEGVLALAGLPLTRLTLRDLPDVGDPALAVVERLPRLKRLYLHELASVGDEGLARLAAARELEVLDIWSLPQMTDATMAVIAGLPNLRELSVRETAATEKGLEAVAALPKLQSLTFRNGTVSPAVAATVKAAKPWKKLDLGR